MAERKIEGFDHKAFAKNLAVQAGQVVPPDISEADKKFVVDIVYKFSLLSGDALIKDASIKFDATQASLITQFIGEWSFHKSIDLIRSQINPSLREGILQKVAFTVFEIAKQATLKKMPPEQIIPLVEHHVNVCFKQALEDLKKKGILDDKAEQAALSQSNIDAMAPSEAQKEAIGNGMSDTKILKLASLALLIKNFPEQKIKSILSKFNQPERDVLSQYLTMEDLESKIDTRITQRYRIARKIFKIVKNSDKEEISNIIKDERPQIREFVLSGASSEFALPVRVAGIICKYLEEKTL